jgi:predicted TIM-barrel fold metal-dependent hydrolase
MREVHLVIGGSSMLISADSHVTIPNDAWQTYLDPAFRDQAPRYDVGDDGIFRVFEGRRKRIDAAQMLGHNADIRPEDYGTPAEFLAAIRAERSPASDPDRRVEAQDVDGVVAEILYFGGPLTDSADDALRIHSYRAYNRWLADFCAPYPDRLIGAAALPVESVELAVTELAAALELGFRTVAIPLFPREGSYAEGDWDRLFAMAAESRTPIGMHILGLRHVPRRFDHSGIYLTQNMMARLLMAEALGELLCSGVLQRHPHLRVVSVEAEIGWLPWVLDRLDHNWHRHRFWTANELTEEPSASFRRQVLATFTKDFVGLRELDSIGSDNVMWSNDFPHAESNWPNSQKLADEWLTGFDDDVKAKLLWQNAARLYGLEPASTADTTAG